MATMNLRAFRCIKRAPCVSLRRRRCSTRAFHVVGELTQLSKGTVPSVGVEAALTHAFSLQDTTAFAQLNGDSNPIHTSPAFATKSGLQAPVVQGLLSASLFATIFGKTIPGALYISQSFRWRTPLYVDEQVEATIRVVRVRKRFIDCETRCVKHATKEVVVEGQATVLLPAAPQQVTEAA